MIYAAMVLDEVMTASNKKDIIFDIPYITDRSSIVIQKIYIEKYNILDRVVKKRYNLKEKIDSLLKEYPNKDIILYFYFNKYDIYFSMVGDLMWKLIFKYDVFTAFMLYIAPSYIIPKDSDRFDYTFISNDNYTDTYLVIDAYYNRKKEMGL